MAGALHSWTINNNYIGYIDKVKMSKSTLMRCLLNGLPLLFSGDYSFFFHYETFELVYFFLLPYANSNKNVKFV